MNIIKIMRTHSDYARTLNECDETNTWVARFQVPVDTPYAYSPTLSVLSYKGREVVILETSHRLFKMIELPDDAVRFMTEESAEDFHINNS